MIIFPIANSLAFPASSPTAATTTDYCVFFCELMSVLAVCFGGVGCRNTAAIFNSIHARGDDSKMGRVHAQPIPANVINDHPERDMHAVQLERITMGSLIARWRVIKTPISLIVSIDNATPQPASICLFYAGPKAIFDIVQIVARLNKSPGFSWEEFSEAGVARKRERVKGGRNHAGNCSSCFIKFASPASF